MDLPSRLRNVTIRIVVIIGSVLLVAQVDCPNIQQMPAEVKNADGIVTSTLPLLGMVQDAQLTVEVVDNGNGDWDSDQVDAVEAAADNIMAQPGDNGNAVTVNTTSVDDPPADEATLAEPVIVVQVAASQDQLDSECGTATIPHPTACTFSHWSQTGTNAANTYYATTDVLPSALTSGVLEELVEHEFSHAILGEADCDYCFNTIANPFVNGLSPVAPTDCDESQSKKDWCKCNLN